MEEFPHTSVCQRNEEAGVLISSIEENEDLFHFIHRVAGDFHGELYRALLGSASEFKDGDLAVGYATRDEHTRALARTLVANTRLEAIDQHPIVDQNLQQALRDNIDGQTFEQIKHLTLGELKQRVLEASEEQVKAWCTGLSSDAIGLLVRIMSNEELIHVGQKVYHRLPNSKIGAKDHLSVRLQPNSPTDHPEDILMSVLSVWSYAEGDLMFGTNPVSSEPDSVKAIGDVLKDLVHSFGLQEDLPWTVLSHIDIQSQIETEHPGSTALWFQSIAGTDAGLKTFDAALDKLVAHAKNRLGRFGLYLEAGQGGDFTNGHTLADMVTLESYKDGLALLLNRTIADNTQREAWSVINDVAGFIGPEVFKNKEQLLRTMLEDVVMGKLHGLTYGLDVCATLHMDISVEDLRDVYRQVMDVRPAFTMVLPYMNDSMLSYLTTGVHQVVEARHTHGFKRNDAMELFFRRVQVLQEDGTPHPQHFGDPVYMYWQYRHAKNDPRPREVIESEGRSLLQRVRDRGVIIPHGHGRNYWDLPQDLEERLQTVVAESKNVLRAQLPRAFVDSIDHPFELFTHGCSYDHSGQLCVDRELYINRPTSGELLHEDSVHSLRTLRAARVSQVDVQIVVSDGLNAFSLSDEGHAIPFLQHIRIQLAQQGLTAAKETLVIHNGRVRAGYHVGRELFADEEDHCSRVLLHLIGERPGTGHQNFSVYITAPQGRRWASTEKHEQVDHDITRVVSGVSDTALNPVEAVRITMKIIFDLQRRSSSLSTKQGITDEMMMKAPQLVIENEVNHVIDAFMAGGAAK